VKRYFGRKLLIYLITFFIAVTVDWCIPRFMPGNPVDLMIARAGLRGSTAVSQMSTFYTQAFGLDQPVWKQYLNVWAAIFHGDLGTSLFLFPTPVKQVIAEALPYDIALLVPAILASWFAGNKFGA
jgi:peptide/nickel transport system permease protein